MPHLIVSLRLFLSTALLATLLCAGTAQATTSATPVTSGITAGSFLDWAQTSFPAIFPGAATDIPLAGYTAIRFYAASGNYLAVRADGAVQAFGPVTGNQLLTLGALSDFKCQVDPVSCLAANTIVITGDQSYPLRVNLFVDSAGAIKSGDYDFHKLDGTMTACTYSSANDATCHGASNNFAGITQSGGLTLSGAATPITLSTTPDTYGFSFTGTVTGSTWSGTFAKTASSSSNNVAWSGPFSVDLAIKLAGADTGTGTGTTTGTGTGLTNIALPAGSTSPDANTPGTIKYAVFGYDSGNVDTATIAYNASTQVGSITFAGIAASTTDNYVNSVNIVVNGSPIGGQVKANGNALVACTAGSRASNSTPNNAIDSSFLSGARIALSGNLVAVTDLTELQGKTFNEFSCAGTQTDFMVAADGSGVANTPLGREVISKAAVNDYFGSGRSNGARGRAFKTTTGPLRYVVVQFSDATGSGGVKYVSLFSQL